MRKSTDLDQTIKVYILSTIDHGLDGEELKTTEEKIEYIKTRFDSEYGWRVKQSGRQTAMMDWLQGLALPITFMNGEILELAVSWGSLPADYSEKQADKILDNYWRLMANKTMQLIDGYRVPKSEGI